MANQDWAFGMQPVHHIGGGAPVINRFPLKHAVQATTPSTVAIFKGQVLKWYTTGGWVLGATKSDSNLSNVIGVAAEYYSGSAAVTNWPDQNGYIGVYDAAEHIFRIQADNAASAAENLGTYVQMCAPIVAGTTTLGSANSGVGMGELDYSAITAADKMLRIIGIDQDVKNKDITAANVNCLVRFNFGHIYTQDTTLV